MRKATVTRQTKETDIAVTLNLDGTGTNDIKTTVPFLDHMLDLCAFHGFLDLKVRAKGDTEIDYHHLMEDLGITMGEALRKAVGDKKGIKRYGSAAVPMDEALARVILDLSGRPYLVYKVKPLRGTVRDVEISLFEDFFRSLSNHAQMNIHIIVEYGRDLHHVIEAVFKAFGRALRESVTIDNRKRRIPSTKGKL
ncbi:MAG TPA: imidazoleglycerol-phosphate dehydratase HisB [Dissulfurispiraceae bacterium]|nr:imidazoleglycerol-phosphate dehydratase HisB [Dissulfurispiraceae bacterium]